MNSYQRENTAKSTTIIWVLFGVMLTAIGCSDVVIDETTDSQLASHQNYGKADSPWQQDVRAAFNPELCAYDESDPYEPRARFNKGPWIGECLDTEKRRPVKVLNAPNEKSSTLELANVYHDGGYWIARAPSQAVSNVYFQLEYFPAVVPAGHTQIRLEFSEPVQLTGQSQWNKGEQVDIYNLVLSAEAVPRVGDKYDLFKGMKDHFGLALRVTSLSARYQSMIVKQEHHVEQWILQLTEREKSELLLFYAYESEALGLESTYHTLFRNCTTELIRNIDGVVEYTVGEHIKKFLTKATEFYPNIIRAALISRGLLPLNQSTDWYPLEDDPTFPW